MGAGVLRLTSEANARIKQGEKNYNKNNAKAQGGKAHCGLSVVLLECLLKLMCGTTTHLEDMGPLIEAK